jgi:hypothetical protein
MTGGDPISARFVRQDFFNYLPQFKLVIVGNNKPILRAVNEAIRRRLNLMPFTVKITEEDGDGEGGRMPLRHASGNRLRGPRPRLCLPLQGLPAASAVTCVPLRKNRPVRAVFAKIALCC